jgi:hypothetical protein
MAQFFFLAELFATRIAQATAIVRNKKWERWRKI